MQYNEMKPYAIWLWTSFILIPSKMAVYRVTYQTIFPWLPLPFLSNSVVMPSSKGKRSVVEKGILEGKVVTPSSCKTAFEKTHKIRLFLTLLRNKMAWKRWVRSKLFLTHLFCAPVWQLSCFSWLLGYCFMRDYPFWGLFCIIATYYIAALTLA